MMADRTLRSLGILASGDAVAARRVARRLIEQGGSPTAPPVLATLVLAAVCLHVDALSAESDASVVDVTAFLARLSLETPPLSDLASSPMQVVRYAADELRQLSRGEVRSLLEPLSRRLDGGT